MQALTYSDTQSITGIVVLEFGTNWCGYCQAAQPFIQEALLNYPEIQHIKIEDGKGQRLGRQFHIKLWPTLILLINGKEVARVTRPQSASEIAKTFGLLLKQNDKREDSSGTSKD